MKPGPKLSNRLCSVDGCERKYFALGFCNTHYLRMRRNGTLDVVGHKRKEPIPCSVEGCDQNARCRGLCGPHYAKSRYNYTPHPPRTVPVEERFWALVDRRGPDDCWEWIGAKQVKGYGDYRTRNQADALTSSLAHRIAWEFTNGPIPNGSHVHHTCGNKGCVNPAHLEPILPRVHTITTWVETLRSMGYTVTEPE